MVKTTITEIADDLAFANELGGMIAYAHKDGTLAAQVYTDDGEIEATRLSRSQVLGAAESRCKNACCQLPTCRGGFSQSVGEWHKTSQNRKSQRRGNNSFAA